MRRRLQFFFIALFMLAGSAAEILSLAAVFPFLAILAKPNTALNIPYIRSLAYGIGVHSSSGLLIAITATFCVLALISGCIRAANTWFTLFFSASVGHDIGKMAFSNVLKQPYASHISLSTPDLIASINIDIPRVISGVVNPTLSLINSCVVIVGLASALLLSTSASGALFIFVSSLLYFLFGFLVKRRLANLGSSQTVHTRRLIAYLQESLGSIRDVILDNSYDFYIRDYDRSDYLLRRTTAQMYFLTSIPKIVVEPLAIALLSIFALFIAIANGSQSAIIVIGVCALAGQKLLPLFQKVFESFALLRANEPSLDKVLELLSNNKPIVLLSCVPTFTLASSILFKNVYFAHKESTKYLVSGLSFEIMKGDCLGVIGETGSGKTTFTDLLMGLLQPTHGTIVVDEQPLSSFPIPGSLLIQSWQSSISHVPQSIYLCDTTIAQNIALAKSPQDIDHDRVLYAAEASGLGSFLQSLPNGLLTRVGERGVRLSGGQRQRIGIARALYKKSSVLILDEATSALDPATESTVINNILNLPDQPTIIMIAHRLTTLKSCNKVIKLHNGSLNRRFTSGDFQRYIMSSC